MGKIDASKPPGFYYVGFVTQRSLDSMPVDKRARWPLNTAMSNTAPKLTQDEALRAAKAHHLRDITVIEN